MDLRNLANTDLSAAMKLENSMPSSPMWFPVDATYQKKIIENGLNFGIFENDKLIGKVGFRSEEDSEYEVDGMIIREKYRNQGIGRKLLTYALNELIKKIHLKKIILFTHPENANAIALYQKFGFVTKELIPNKYGKGMHRIRMEKIIKTP